MNTWLLLLLHWLSPQRRSAGAAAASACRCRLLVVFGAAWPAAMAFGFLRGGTELGFFALAMMMMMMIWLTFRDSDHTRQWLIILQ